MTTAEVLETLRKLGSEKVQAMNVRHGVTGEQFGVKMGDIRIVAKSIKDGEKLVPELWETKTMEAGLVAILPMKPA